MAEILLVEDDPLLVEGLQNAFTFHGHRLEVAGDGLAGVTLAQRHCPDLVLLDVMLPGPDGFEVCRRLRQSRPDLPVIFLTAKGQE
ncbi:MAG TPA: response regulator, partial [Candidatus Aminicenantes bacterium]|nr:response regulator [Candidatus Aminicenantes bacterium]